MNATVFQRVEKLPTATVFTDIAVVEELVVGADNLVVVAAK